MVDSNGRLEWQTRIRTTAPKVVAGRLFVRLAWGKTARLEHPLGGQPGRRPPTGNSDQHPPDPAWAHLNDFKALARLALAVGDRHICQQRLVPDDGRKGVAVMVSGPLAWERVSTEPASVAEMH